jgi:hypothetical protein
MDDMKARTGSRNRATARHRGLFILSERNRCHLPVKRRDAPAFQDGTPMDSSLVAAVTRTIADFRGGGIDGVSQRHVRRWLTQFDVEAHDDLLRELAHVLQRTYFSRSRVRHALEALASSSLTSRQPPDRFWREASLLDLYLPGHSQHVLLQALRRLLHRSYGAAAPNDHDGPGPFVYVDDFLMSGSRVIEDVGTWLQGAAPPVATVHLVFLVVHTHGLARADHRIRELAHQASKEVVLRWWHAARIEDHPDRLEVSHVLRPAAVPDQARAYYRDIASQSPPSRLRVPGTLPATSVFRSPSGRSTLERHLLLAGLRIREQFEDPASYMRPLGFQGLPTFGFGTLVVSYRNCPNHCPLAFWFGDPGGALGHPWDSWYPLFPRRMRQQLEEVRGLSDRVFQYPPPACLAVVPSSRPLPR